MRFVDTMSMHIACSGFSSDQRIQKLSKVEIEKVSEIFLIFL